MPDWLCDNNSIVKQRGIFVIQELCSKSPSGACWMLRSYQIYSNLSYNQHALVSCNYNVVDAVQRLHGLVVADDDHVSIVQQYTM
jgi:hypothetical protein